MIEEDKIIEFHQGADVPLEIDWEDKNEAPLKPNDLVDYKVLVFYEKDMLTPVLEFKRIDGDLVVDVVNNDEGLVELKFDRNFTKDAQFGTYYFYTHWHFLDTDFHNNERVEIYKTIGFKIIK